MLHEQQTVIACRRLQLKRELVGAGANYGVGLSCSEQHQVGSGLRVFVGGRVQRDVDPRLRPASDPGRRLASHPLAPLRLGRIRPIGRSVPIKMP